MRQQQQWAGEDGGDSKKGEPRILTWDGPRPLPPIPDTNYAVFLLELMAAYGDTVAVVSHSVGNKDDCCIVSKLIVAPMVGHVGADGHLVVMLWLW